MIAVTNSYMNYLDKLMIKKYKIKSLILMEHAGLRVFEYLENNFNLKKENISIFCGIGNNGADGIVLARLLYIKNYNVEVYINKKNKKRSIDFEKQKKIIEALKIPLFYWDDFSCLNRKNFYNTTIYIDALLGTGITRKIEGSLLNLILKLNEQKGIKLSIDIPSGINGTTGEGKIFFTSDIVISFGFLKLAHLLRDDFKKIVLGDISFYKKIKIEEDNSIFYLIKEDAKMFFLKRKKNSHKGNFGHIGILGGNYKMSGASLMAGKSALKIGAGLVTIWLEINKINNLIGKEIEIMLEPIETFINKKINSLIIGPGLTNLKNLKIKEKLKLFKGNILIDAGGLNLLKKNIIKREWINGKLILTPHSKEMANLMNLKIEKVNSDRIAVAKQCSKKYDCITVLKGYKTIITNGKKVSINLTGNPGMATAGSGDVLSGIIAGLMGQGYDSFDSSWLGTYVHGMAGDLAKEKYGENSLTSIDIINFIFLAIKNIKKIEKNKGWLKNIKE